MQNINFGTHHGPQFGVSFIYMCLATKNLRTYIFNLHPIGGTIMLKQSPREGEERQVYAYLCVPDRTELLQCFIK